MFSNLIWFTPSKRGLWHSAHDTSVFWAELYPPPHFSAENHILNHIVLIIVSDNYQIVSSYNYHMKNEHILGWIKNSRFQNQPIVIIQNSANSACNIWDKKEEEEFIVGESALANQFHGTHRNAKKPVYVHISSSFSIYLFHKLGHSVLIVMLDYG